MEYNQRSIFLGKLSQICSQVFLKWFIYAEKSNKKSARGRTRTGTVSPPGDFESPTSTNSITRAFETAYL